MPSRRIDAKEDKLKLTDAEREACRQVASQLMDAKPEQKSPDEKRDEIRQQNIA
jgi:hypothetical protein